MIVTPYFYPKIGGLETYAYNFALALKRQYNFDIVVVTSNHKDKKDTIEKIKGLKIYRLAPLWKISNTPVNPFWYWKIKKIIREENPDYINVHTPVPFIADITALAAGKKPLFVTYHAFSLYKSRVTVFNIIIKAYKLFERYLFTRADRIIVVSDAVKKNISSRYRKKVITISNSLLRDTVPQLNKYQKRKEINIIFIGNLDKTHDWKGLEDILNAVTLIRSELHKKVSISIVGDGNNRKHYEYLVMRYGIDTKVKFYGKKTGKAKERILQNATLAVMYPKSSNDAFPTVVLEYWAHSLPIIASDIRPINKILKNKKTAYLTEAKNPLSLAGAIEHIVSNKELAKSLITNGYNELLEKYVLENQIIKFYSLLKGATVWK